MGQDQSAPIDESVPPVTLESRTVDAVADYMKSGKVKRIVVMTGAGISTSAGIPDFRSPDTGLYANLARLNLPYAEAVFDISYFRENPLPFYTLAHELYPGKYRPTITHSFIKLLYDKGLLLKAFTQNIDCLEREAGVPDELIVEAHGSFARQRCIECRTAYPDGLMRRAIEAREVPRCTDSRCDGLVKPDIVFFGEQLPQEFFVSRTLPASADLAIVMGTSLSVQPFAGLPEFCREETPRLLVNKERVGQIGCRADDVVLLTDCDDGVRRLADACGWLQELESLWAQTAPNAAKERMDAMNDAAEREKEKTTDQKIEEEVERLTRQVEETLKVAHEHGQHVKAHVEEKQADGEKGKNSEESTPSKTEAAPAIEKLKADSRPEDSVAEPVYSIPARENLNTKKSSMDSGGLNHVFPHIEKTSSL